MHKSHVHKLLPEYILSELGIIIIIIIRHWVIDVGVSFSKMMALAILLNNSHVVGAASAALKSASFVLSRYAISPF
jgi:hypothetical protein